VTLSVLFTKTLVAIDEEKTPWFIGTLLSQFGENIEPGRLLVSPALVVSRIYGTYNSHSNLVRNRNVHVYSWLYFMEGGLTKDIDYSFELDGFYAHASEANSFHVSDVHLLFGFQISKDKKKSWIPDFRVLIGQGIPLGKYDHLNPAMGFADITGSGAHETALVFVAQKIFYTRPKHPYKWNLNLTTIHPSRVPVSGLSFYGGGPGVHGIATPGQRFIVNLSYEYKFSKHWGWGMDIHFEYQNSSSFHTKSGIPQFSGAPSTDNFSLAPAIEYDFSEDLAVQAGFWYSLFGRNTFPFFNGFFELSYVF
jgi:hypothetical protein